MAVVVPLIVAYGAAAAGATAAVASVAAIGASLIAGATGISAKIDKAAAKVFGKDAVTAFNIAGAVYGSFGGFSGAGPSTVWDNVSGAFAGAGADAATGVAWSDPSARADTLTNMGATGESALMAGEVPGAMGGDYAGVQYMADDAAVGAMGGDYNGAQYETPTADTTLARDSRLAGNAGSKTTSETGALDRVWNSLGEKGKASLIQAGGQMLGGWAQGRAQQEMAEQDRRDFERRHRPLVTVTRPGALVSLRRRYVVGE